jgi:hypothetical protein
MFWVSMGLSEDKLPARSDFLGGLASEAALQI